MMELAKRKTQRYIRAGTVSIDIILHLIRPKEIGNERPKETFHGRVVKVDSLRLRMFKEKGVTCIKCGQKASHFAVERHDNIGGHWHLNLYSVKDEIEVLMTKDHIQPVSKGGLNLLSNLQPMCTWCNEDKGNGEPRPKKKKKKPCRDSKWWDKTKTAHVSVSRESNGGMGIHAIGMLNDNGIPARKASNTNTEYIVVEVPVEFINKASNFLLVADGGKK